MNRRQARMKAVQALFQIDLSQTPVEEAIRYVAREESDHPLLNELVSGTIQYLPEIDRRLNTVLKQWTMDRIGKVDRNILRMAVYELDKMDDIPVNVTLNEAVEQGKMFGGEESGKFVNGVLQEYVNQFHNGREQRWPQNELTEKNGQRQKKKKSNDKPNS